ncbi:MAG: hypothetical protein ACI9OJ_001063 [Myxococcota bacterium]|jgi:hypothetical protein
MRAPLCAAILVTSLAACTTATRLSYWVVEAAGTGQRAITVTTMSGNPDLNRPDAKWLATYGDKARSEEHPDLYMEAACRDPKRTPEGWRPGDPVTILTSGGPVTRTVGTCSGGLPGHIIEAVFTLDGSFPLPALAVQGGEPDASARVIAPAWRDAGFDLREQVIARLSREIPAIRTLAKTVDIDSVTGDFGGPTGLVRALFHRANCDGETEVCTLHALLAQKSRGVLEIVRLAGYMGTGNSARQYGDFDALKVLGLLRERRDGPWRIIVESSAVGYVKTELLQVSSGRWVATFLSGFGGG